MVTFGPVPSLTLPLRFAMTRGSVRLTEVRGRFVVRDDGITAGIQIDAVEAFILR